MKRYKILLMLIDAILINLAFFLALWLRLEFEIPPNFWTAYKNSILIIPLIQVAVFILFKIYNILWQYTSTKELIQLGIAVLIGSLGCLGFGVMTGHLLPRSVYIIYLLIILIFMAGSRISIRILYRLLKHDEFSLKMLFNKETDVHKRRIMIIGAGEASSVLIKELQKEFNSTNDVVLAVDDDTRKHHSSIHGVPVRGTIEDIPTLVTKWLIDEIIIAIPSASRKRISQILKICNTTNCKLKIAPPLTKAVEASLGIKNIRPVNIEDLLGREEIDLDATGVANYLKDNIILVTGGGGSIGSELCRQIMCFSPKKLIIFDIYENNAYDLQNELLQRGISPLSLEVIIGSVRDAAKLRQVIEKYTPNIIFHAAAHKHVPLMEANPEEAVKNNVFGTLNTALLAKELKVKKFILISTDKAVNPTNVMGATKRICEMIIQSLSKEPSDTEFAAVRFGNVLGSNGSVIPLFKRQLEAGGPLTVTHAEIIRYFMTIPEAARLILQAMSFAKGGEIFVLDMGEPVKILDLAKNFIKLSGLSVGKDIEIKITGLRPGEKLYEELLMDEEGLQKTGCDKIFVAHPLDLSFEELNKQLDLLLHSIYDKETLKACIGSIVPTYKMPLASTEKSKPYDTAM
ncbi:polysaccharide biosynthesis protein [Cellulosilyticum sp. I15G10I2]|uniref:polysaccharide biosynthesis protein n=1 Tax=Cellulosilyticum sp. I15G10I2 TaxID=1892843 RepID=UPI00085C7DD8|nr:nucleoside-diphosphate sugar epimerase/dehydratase [Cellulosilyticum sp. I15G10I2]